MGETLRLFVALELPEAVQQALASVWTPLRRTERMVKWVDPEGIHVTLKFLGDVPVERLPMLTEQLSRAAQACGPLAFRVSRVGAFPSLAAPRVLWAGLEGDLESLGRLQQAVEHGTVSLGFPREERRFTPHLTIGRVREGLPPHERRRIGQAFGQVDLPPDLSFGVGRLSLMQSTLTPQGARYRCLKTWLLGQSRST
ncbi:MAG: RNA 2',3'-cyclic phosphodiesterase [Dehalococcoidia bacterium]|nr:RNA 2',3'-cyclic phosphodiesterase [Dehalococcoidia bacterium]MDW8119159.1 RNA 2',3'-cyclic phosphodiesterase [Chloroflexota bacterium]